MQQAIHLSIIDHGFVLREMIPNFNQYLGASIIGQSSHLYNLCTAGGVILESNLSYEEGPLYIRDEKEWSISVRPIGFHFIAELPGIPSERLLDNEAIKSDFLHSLDSAGLSVVDVFQHTYHPYGYSVVAILESSHATVHTWPEHEYASVDLFVCSDPDMGRKAINLFAERMNVENPQVQLLERGISK
jgi:S-adenosylmethionine decarboxylase proenzyme